PKAAVVCFDDRSTDGQSHPHAVRFGCKKRVKDAIDIFRLNARSRIRYYDKHIAFVIYTGLNVENATWLGHQFHRIDGIGNKIEYHMLQLNAISHDQGKAFGQLGVNYERALLKLVIGQSHDFVYDFIHIDRNAILGSDLEPLADVFDQVGSIMT